MHARRDRQERLAGAGGADQGDQLHLVVQQQIHGHRLLEVAGHDAVDRLARPGDGNDVAGVGEEPRQSGVAFVRRVLEHQVLVGHQFRRGLVVAVGRARGQPLQAGDRELPLLVELVDQLARRGERRVSGVQPVRIHAVRLEVLAGDPQRVALHAGVDVLGDEDGPLALRVQVVGHAEDPVVGEIQVQRERRRAVAAVDADAPALLVPQHALEEPPDRAAACPASG